MCIMHVEVSKALVTRFYTVFRSWWGGRGVGGRLDKALSRVACGHAPQDKFGILKSYEIDFDAI